VALRGPARPDSRWQARAQHGFALTACRLDRAGGRSARRGGRVAAGDNAQIRRAATAAGCSDRARIAGHARAAPPAAAPRAGRPVARCACARASSSRPCTPPARARRPRLAVKTYARRAGIAGTLARGIRRCRPRRTRYRGQAKAHLDHILTATGLNFLRLGAWFAGTPRRQLCRAPFARLLAAPATA